MGDIMSGKIDNVTCPFGPEWTVIDKIGQGSYGSVYLIERKAGKDTFKSAMKVIKVPEADKIMERTGQSREEIVKYYQSLKDALLPEISLMYKLRDDDHIVKYEDYKEVPHASGIGMDIYIKMEYLESLPHWIKKHELTNKDVLNLGIQLCQ